jgi:hypothetical protein
MKALILIIVGCFLIWGVSIYAVVITYQRFNAAVARTESLNKRADVMEKQWRLLDLRIKKQEGIKHGYGH